jgi:hypothetical protein
MGYSGSPVWQRAAKDPDAFPRVDDDAWGGHGQAVVPFLGEDTGALKKRLGKSGRPCVVVAGRVECDDSEAAFVGLQANPTFAGRN